MRLGARRDAIGAWPQLPLDPNKGVESATPGVPGVTMVLRNAGINELASEPCRREHSPLA